MAIDRTGISSLQSGAGEITYSGNQGPKSPDQQLMAQADPMLVNEYKKYVFEMEEQGQTPISFKEFVRQVMSGMAQGGRAGYQGGGDAGPMGNPAVMEEIEDAREFRIANPNVEDIADYKGYYERLKKLEQLRKLFKGMKPMSGAMGPPVYSEQDYPQFRPGMPFYQMPELNTGDYAYGGTAKPTYTQSRKQQLAGGGIAGLKQIGKPGGRVEPGIMKYGAWDWIKEKAGDVKDKIFDDLIPNEIKENPMLSAAIAGGAINQWGLPDVLTESLGMGPDVGQNWIGNLLGGSDAVIGGDRPEGQASLGEYLTSFLPGSNNPTQQAENQTVSSIMNNPFYSSLMSSVFPQTQGTNQSGILNALLGNTNLQQNLSVNDILGVFGLGTKHKFLDKDILPDPYLKTMVSERVAGVPGTKDRWETSYGDQQPVFVKGTPAVQAIPAKYETKLNPFYPIGAGMIAHDYAKDHPGPTLPENTARDASRIDMASAIGGDDLRFKLDPSLVKAAQGGRIGYAGGGNYAQNEVANQLYGTSYGVLDPFQQQQIDSLIGQVGTTSTGTLKAKGGRIGAQEGGLMDLGGMEKDYREEGGFVPIGGQERADDVPARLSKNEFVFTADAVRSAGGGDIDKGAEIMENVMNNLEQGGQISEESQGLEGARNMFATAQKLEGVL